MFLIIIVNSPEQKIIAAPGRRKGGSEEEKLNRGRKRKREILGPEDLSGGKRGEI